MLRPMTVNFVKERRKLDTLKKIVTSSELRFMTHSISFLLFHAEHSVTKLFSNHSILEQKFNCNSYSLSFDFSVKLRQNY